MIEQKKPLVSIAIPVYNGEKYIADAIQSILDQDYENIELIICDNHSSDTTEQICAKFVRRDKRIKYYRNEVNIGACENFNKAFRLTNGEYFMWNSHDDLRARNCISECLLQLHKHPQAILCTIDTCFIDENGKYIKNYDTIDTIEQDVNQRIQKLVARSFWSEICGLFRSDTLKKTRMLLDCFGNDVVLLTELTLLGEFTKVNKPLFLYRDRVREMKEYIQYLGSNHKKLVSNKAPYTEMVHQIINVILVSSLLGDEKKIQIIDNIIMKFSDSKSFLGAILFQEKFGRSVSKFIRLLLLRRIRIYLLKRYILLFSSFK